ncbi:DUF3850 domain-containing protein [Commensalibacter melissae]|uniref:DUF3850 domain-containing protein n=1 Tax=Commensalibacter melissae TaxID=2070537 RepID=UPI0012D9772F|nr:DUF3850 domain-containing protein [Commensalibacter melissae]
MNTSNKNDHKFPRFKIHRLKICPIFFEKVCKGLKTAELRKADRDYQINDILILLEYNNDMYTGRTVQVKIIDICDVDQYAPNYLLLSIKLV